MADPIKTLHERNIEMGAEVVDLIHKMIRDDPKSRITLAEIEKHGWIKDLYPA